MEWMLEHPKGMVVAPMGAGKTVIGATAFRALRRAGLVSTALVLAPKRVITHTWARELLKWSHLYKLPAAQIPDSGTTYWAVNQPMVLCNYDRLEWLIEHDPLTRDVIILDECTKFKSPASKRRTRFVRHLFPNAKYIWGLTANPVTEGDLEAMWSMWRAIDGGERLGRTVTGFRERWLVENTYSRRRRPRPQALKEITALVRDATCVIPEDHVAYQRPALIVQDHRMTLGREAQSIHNLAYEELVLALKAGQDVIAHKAAAVQKCKQITSGAVYYDKQKSWEYIDDNKLLELDDILHSAKDENVIIVYWYGHQLHRLRARYPDLRAVGEPGAIEQWQRGRLRRLALQPQSAGHGLNLQAGGRRLVFFDLPWSHDATSQVIGRLWRQGQPHAVFIHRIIAEATVDLDVLRAWRYKITVAEAIKARLQGKIPDGEVE